ncbi:MAG: HNH endonuclease, partial [Acidimicrobiia bacterium]|nr:HNH endonuclease [Acidimicrobiia bacterium]
PAELRTALELGTPPDFDGVTCSVQGCNRRHGLEWDHTDPVANGGPTSYTNLSPKCWPHHREKTLQDRRAGLLEGVIKNLEERLPP